VLTPHQDGFDRMQRPRCVGHEPAPRRKAAAILLKLGAFDAHATVVAFLISGCEVVCQFFGLIGRESTPLEEPDP